MEGLVNIALNVSFWTIITFLLVLVILWKTAWKPILKALDDRANFVVDNIEKAKKEREEADKLYERYKSLIKEAEHKREEILGMAKREAEEIRKTMIDKAREDAQKEKEKAITEIEYAKNTALTEIKSEAVHLAISLAEEILKKNITIDEQDALIEETLKKMRN
jgi:F-type H+-transporting ATPase subunit b